MTQELIKKEETGIAVFDENEVRESQAMAGQQQKTVLPFVPLLEVNNKSDRKMALIDGVEQEVDLPARKGFVVTMKSADAREYTKAFLDGNTSGVILKERFMVQKKYKQDDVDIKYKSDEFDGWDGVIKLYDQSNRKNVIFEGTYADIKKTFTRTSKEGATEKDYNLYVILYINLKNSGEIYRLKVKMNSDNNWFDYKNSFKENEPWAGFLTNFKLESKTVGKINYWYLIFERGAQVNLGEQLKIQKEINRYFLIANAVINNAIKPKEDNWFDGVEETDLPISQIPF
jgi:hypothetical protein